MNAPLPLALAFALLIPACASKGGTTDAGWYHPDYAEAGVLCRPLVGDTDACQTLYCESWDLCTGPCGSGPRQCPDPRNDGLHACGAVCGP